MQNSHQLEHDSKTDKTKEANKQSNSKVAIGTFDGFVRECCQSD